MFMVIKPVWTDFCDKFMVNWLQPIHDDGIKATWILTFMIVVKLQR